VIDMPPSKEFFEEFQYRSNAADRGKCVGYLGRLSPEKEIDVLIETAKLLIKKVTK
jgi:glycosyltransferase involved in cell wall biosynthesis